MREVTPGAFQPLFSVQPPTLERDRFINARFVQFYYGEWRILGIRKKIFAIFFPGKIDYFPGNSDARLFMRRRIPRDCRRLVPLCRAMNYVLTCNFDNY